MVYLSKASTILNKNLYEGDYCLFNDKGRSTWQGLPFRFYV